MVETPRTPRQNKVAQKTRSRSKTTNETQKYQPNTSVVTTKYENPTKHDALWQPSEDGVIQSRRGAPATLSRNRFDNLYITGETDHDNDTIRWEPKLYIRNELLEYQHSNLQTRTTNTSDTSHTTTPTSNTTSTLLTTSRRRQEPQHRKADTSNRNRKIRSSQVQKQSPTIVWAQTPNLTSNNNYVSSTNSIRDLTSSISSTTEDLTSQMDSISPATSTEDLTDQTCSSSFTNFNTALTNQRYKSPTKSNKNKLHKET